MRDVVFKLVGCVQTQDGCWQAVQAFFSLGAQVFHDVDVNVLTDLCLVHQWEFMGVRAVSPTFR